MSNSPILKHSIYTIGTLLLGAILLCYAGFHNQYPIVYPDTGTYIGSGFESWVPDDRPVFYGLFIRHISLATSPWLVIFTQGLIVAFLIRLCLREFTSGRDVNSLTIVSIILLLISTGISTAVSHLMPDIFTPILILSLLVLIFGKKCNVAEKTTLWTFYIIAICVHTSHILIDTTLLITFATIYLFKKGSRQSIRLINIVIAFVFLCLFLIFNKPITAAVTGKQATPDTGAGVFLIAKLNELGVLDEYLNDNCEKQKWKICEYKDNIPTNFLWDYANSPLYKTGGWKANHDEYWNIIRDIASKPKYMLIIAYKSLKNIFVMFFSFETPAFGPQREGTPPYVVISTHFPVDKREYLIDDQNGGQQKSIENNGIQFVTVMIALLVTILCLIKYTPYNTRLRWFYIYILTAIIVNAAVCGIFSAISSRYQNRVIWLLPLVLIIIIVNSKQGKIISDKIKEFVQPAIES